MTRNKFGLYSKSVVTPDGVKEAVVLVDNGTIYGVVDRDAVPEGFSVDNLENLVVMPGLVDSHVHINEPGRTEWEGFRTATRAAAAGGTTTLIDMPLNSIPATTTLSAFNAKLNAAKNKCYIDVGFWGGVVPGNTDELEPRSEER